MIAVIVASIIIVIVSIIIGFAMSSIVYRGLYGAAVFYFLLCTSIIFFLVFLVYKIGLDSTIKSCPSCNYFTTERNQIYCPVDGSELRSKNGFY